MPALRQLLKAEYGKVLSKWHLEKLLRNPFYIGTYEWEGKSYAGTHPPLVSPEIFSRVRDFHTSSHFPVCSAVLMTIVR